MDDTLILATETGVVIAKPDGVDWRAARRGLHDQRATSVIARAGVIIAGTHKGLFRSPDFGESWEAAHRGLTIPHIRWLAFHPGMADFSAAGTEPAGLFISHNGGDSWQARPEVEALRDHLGWWLPYSPEAGCVRGLAFHGRRGYAAVEVGGVLRSDDEGKSWSLAAGSDGLPKFVEPQPGFIHADVHSIEVHPSSPDLVFAATNAGLYRSRDGGASWEMINLGGYTRAIRVDPADPDHIISGPARNVGSYGTIIETNDRGQTWSPMTAGLDAPWPDTMVERFTPINASTLGAVLDNGEVFAADLRTRQWRRILESVPGVNALTVMAA